VSSLNGFSVRQPTDGLVLAGSRLSGRDWLRGAQRARRLGTLSLAWLCIEGAATTTAGVIAGSTALLANGLDGAIEGLASVTMLWRFSGARTLSASSERRAQQLLAVSFGLLAPYVALAGALSRDARRQVPGRGGPGEARMSKSRGRLRGRVDRWAPGRALLRAADPRMAELADAQPDLDPDRLFDSWPSDLWGALVLQVIGQLLSLAAALVDDRRRVAARMQDEPETAARRERRHECNLLTPNRVKGTLRPEQGAPSPGTNRWREGSFIRLHRSPQASLAQPAGP
jgi:hypothetical protein